MEFSFPFDNVGQMTIDPRMAKFCMPANVFTQFLEAFEEHMYKFDRCGANDDKSMAVMYAAAETKVLEFNVEDAQLMLDEEFHVREELTKYVRYHTPFDFHTYTKAFFKAYDGKAFAHNELAFLGPFTASVLPLQTGAGEIITTVSPSDFYERRISVSNSRVIALTFTKQHCLEAHQILNKYRHSVDFAVMSSKHFEVFRNHILTKERLLQEERVKQTMPVESSASEDEIEEVDTAPPPHVKCLRADQPCCMMSAPHSPSPVKLASKKRPFNLTCD